jgi:hypothetical protein
MSQARVNGKQLLDRMVDWVPHHDPYLISVAIDIL